MQDNRALQAGTSHHLGQNFARAFELKYQNEAGDWDYAWNTSWGVTTRLVGALVMTHGDDNGLVIPPRLAPIQVAVIPIWKGNDPKAEILEAASRVRRDLAEAGVRVEFDDRDNLSPGFKYHEWEMLGVPLRVELGPKDLRQGTVACVTRLSREKIFVPLAEVATRAAALLEQVQDDLFAAARRRRDAATFEVEDFDTFKEKLADPGGFLLAHWCGNAACEERVQEETKATIRCLAFEQAEEAGACIVCGGASNKRAHFAKGY
jgi:prolyl-tRNA synthetase